MIAYPRGLHFMRSIVGAILSASWILRSARVALLLVLVAAGWCVTQNRLSLRAWKTPISYGGDSLIVLARVQSAAQGNYWPLLPKRIPELGAPFTATWDGHPTSEDWLYLGSGLLARWIGLAPAANLAVLLSFILAAVSAYACCRLLRCRWEWSFLSALAFAWSPYAFYRGLGHVMLAYDWLVPPAALVAIWLVTPDDVIPGRKPFILAVLVAFATGWHNSYYTFLFLQWIALAGCALVLRRRSGRAILVPSAIAGSAILGWSLANVDSLPFFLAHGADPRSLMRSQTELEFFALKPLSLLMPLPDHRWSWWADWGARYRGGYDPNNEALYSYIGILGIGALLWLAGECARKAVRRLRGPWPAQAWLVLWVVLFSTAVGINPLLGMIGLRLFRATNRYSIAILALALLFLAQRLTLVGSRWPAWRRFLTLAALGVLVAWDQMPRPAVPAQIETVASQVSSDQAFVAAMQQRIPAGGMVFQLPIMDFPESTPLQGMGAYEHLRPYLYSSRLRFSFGNDKSDFAAGWQSELAQQEPGQMVEALERYGFSAIQLNRAGYGDQGQALIEAFRKFGRDQVITSTAGDQVCILLHPSAQPRQPEMVITFGRGWHSAEHDASGQQRRWTKGNAQLQLLNTTDKPITRSLSFAVTVLDPRRLLLRQGNITLLDTRVVPGDALKLGPTRLTLAPGVTTLDWLTDAPPIPPSRLDPRKLAFLVRDLRVTESP